jgi:hypothetical protein
VAPSFIWKIKESLTKAKESNSEHGNHQKRAQDAEEALYELNKFNGAILNVV